MITRFAETYRGKSNAELALLAKEKECLQEDARQALETEMQKRGLCADATVDAATTEMRNEDEVAANEDLEQPAPFQKHALIVFLLASCPVFLACLYHRIPARGALFIGMAAGLLVAGIWLVMVEDILSPNKR